MRIYYECELCEDASGWSAVLPDGFGKAVHAPSREKAAQKAASSLKAGVMRRLLCGEPVPQPEHLEAPSCEGGMLLAVVADVDTDGLRVTASEAADILGVSNARVTQLLDSGKLVGYREGRDSYVTLPSIRRRLEGAASQPGSGAPADI
ncbi:MAG: helix-turn-helix domain-containing protein [Coriobacteriales bacterium]